MYVLTLSGSDLPRWAAALEMNWKTGFEKGPSIYLCVHPQSKKQEPESELEVDDEEEEDQEEEEKSEEEQE